MSDETEKPDEDNDGPVGGERLRKARRENDISIRDVAKELHLDEHKVRALERNEFDALGAPVFAKGYLRKYAQLVNVNGDDVLADYYHMTRSAEAPPVISVRPRPRQELSPGPWITIIVVIILAVTAYLWFTRPDAPGFSLPGRSAESGEVAAAPDDAETPDSAAAEDAPEPDESEAEARAQAEIEPEPQPATRTSFDPAPRAVQPPIEPPLEETTSPAIADGQVRVLLSYTGDCWTEVTDATGRNLFFDLGRDGRSVELSGAEPLSVLFGSPGNVTVKVNGDDYALPASARPDRPMRLAISGQ
jgi:cytoskeleton protein RodZ